MKKGYNLYTHGETIVTIQSPFGTKYKISILSKRACAFVLRESLNCRRNHPVAEIFPRFQIGNILIKGFQADTGYLHAVYIPVKPQS